MNSLFDNVEMKPGRKAKRTIQERFEDFMRLNPRVFELFKQFAEDRLKAGFERYSSDAILARVRWEVALPTTGEGGFRLNDHFTSRLARRLAEEDERFKDFFEFRKLQRA